MRTLALSYNIKRPFAALIDNGRPARFVQECEYYDMVNPARTFPENAVKRILSDETIDSVAILGKPFLYLDNLLLLNRYLFPRSLTVFMNDVSDYFRRILALPRIIYDLQKDVLAGKAKPERYPVYYVKLDNALAQTMEANDDVLIITCLTDVFEGASLSCFERKAGKVRLTRESNMLNSFGNLLKIYHETGPRADLGRFVKVSEDKLFRLKKKYFTIRNNAFALKNEYIAAQGDFSRANERLLLNVFSRLMQSLAANDATAIFLTDCPLPSIISQAHPDIVFKELDQRYVIGAAGRYLYDRVAEMERNN